LSPNIVNAAKGEEKGGEREIKFFTSPPPSWQLESAEGIGKKKKKLKKRGEENK